MFQTESVKWLWIKPGAVCVSVDKIVAVYLDGGKVKVAGVDGTEWTVTHPELQSVEAVMAVICGG